MAIATFSRTVKDRNGFGTWNVRLIPACTNRCEGKPPTARPSKRTSPWSGACRPEITLMQVVLPEPLGPTSPRISPPCKLKVTPSSARKPPKRFTRPSMARSGAASRDIDPSAPQQRYETIGQEQHESHDQQTVDELKVLRRGNADCVIDAIENNDPEDRPDDGRGSSEQHEYNGKDREFAAEHRLWIKHRHVPGKDAA